MSLIFVWAGGVGGPPVRGDGTDYDSIGWQLAQGRGFGHSWSDVEFRRPYEESKGQREKGEYDELLAKQGDFSVTAYRPPGLPLLLGGIYTVVGRHFFVWRLMNAAMMAVGLTLTVRLAYRLGGLGVGILAGILGLVDPTIKKYSGSFLTEGPSFLLMVLLVWFLVQAVQRRKLSSAFGAGCWMGLAVLFRSIFLFWYVLPVGVLWYGFSRSSVGGSRWRGLAAVGIFMIGGLGIPGGWWVRNCYVLESFMPAGTQGGIGLVGGFSDFAYENEGFWVSHDRPDVKNPQWKPKVNPFEEVYGRAGYGELSPVMKEREKAIFGQKFVRRWVKENPGKTFWLSVKKLVYLWYRPATLHVTVFVVLGYLAFRWVSAVRAMDGFGVLLLIPVVQTMVVVATYNTRDGRFQIPFLGAYYILGAVGLWYLGAMVYERVWRGETKKI